MKTIIIACGSGIATSSIMKDAVQTIADDMGVQIKIHQCGIHQIEDHVSGSDLIVSSSKITKDYGIPCLLGLAFLTGVNEESVKEEVEKIIRG